MYTITNHDITTNAVYVTFEHEGKVLNHTIIVEDLSKVAEITKTIKEHYKDFVTSLSNVKEPPNTQELDKLLNKEMK